MATGVGGVEPDFGLALVLQASQGVEEQQKVVRGSPAIPGEPPDAVEPGEQRLAVERAGDRWSVEGYLRN